MKKNRGLSFHQDDLSKSHIPPPKLQTIGRSNTFRPSTASTMVSKETVDRRSANWFVWAATEVFLSIKQCGVREYVVAILGVLGSSRLYLYSAESSLWATLMNSLLLVPMVVGVAPKIQGMYYFSGKGQIRTSPLKRFARGAGAGLGAGTPPRVTRANSLGSSGFEAAILSVMGTPRGKNEKERRDFWCNSRFASCLSSSELDDLFILLSWREVKRGEVVVKSGATSSEGVFILAGGSLGVFVSSNKAGKMDELSYKMEVGESFGDLDVLDLYALRTRAGTLKALEHSFVVQLTQAKWMKFCEDHPLACTRYLRASVGHLSGVAEFMFSTVLGISPADATSPDYISVDSCAWSQINWSSMTTSESIVPVTAGSGDGNLLRIDRLAAGDKLFLPDDSFHVVLLLKGSLTAIPWEGGFSNETLDGDVFDASPEESQPPSVTIVSPCVIGSRQFFMPTPSRTVACEYIATTDCEIIRLHEESNLKQLAAQNPLVFARLMHLLVVSLFPLVDKFVGFGLKRSWITAGKFLFSQSEPAECMSIVISGRVKMLAAIEELPPGIENPVSPVRNVLFEAGRGDCIGEEAVLFVGDSTVGGGRGMTALCVRDCEVVQINLFSFEKMFGLNPHVMLEFIKRIYQHRANIVHSGFIPHKVNPVEAAHSAHPSFSACCPQNSLQRFRSLGSSATVAIVPLNKESEGAVCAFIQLLQAELSNFGSVAIMDEKNSADTDFLPAMPRKNLSARINSMEITKRFVLLLASSHQTLWSQLCVSQADRVLLVALHDSLPTIYNPEQAVVWDAGASWPAEIRSLQSRRELVLLHDNGSISNPQTDLSSNPNNAFRQLFNWRQKLGVLTSAQQNHHTGFDEAGSPIWKAPRLTKKWLDARPGVILHHHVRLTSARVSSASANNSVCFDNECYSPGDVARIARHIAGASVGLVLGGGGARGLAHLGILRAMEELGIPVDFVGGTSQGAFMAAAYSQSLSVQAMLPAVQLLSSRIGNVFSLLRDFTLPILSMFSGKTFSVTIREALGTGDIVDSWIPFFCISTCVTCPFGDAIRVHRRGDMWRFVRASMSLVGFLPPMFDNGELLVDGGYCDNLPAAEMKKLGASFIIGVDVENKDESAFQNIAPLPDHVSGWWVLGFRFLEHLGLVHGRKLPSQKDITGTLCYIAHTNQLPLSQANLDVYIHPNLDEYMILDYHKQEEIVNLAYEYSKTLLKSLPWDNRIHE